ncbi:MAG: hypothetical protein HYZ18_15130, partial [Pseudogulbenkiania sp.]|nr:hypothetical protein [Pseudogulbenkiania sp.]
NDPHDGEPLTEARERLLADAKCFSVPPSELVDSGNGLGLFWRLEVPIPVAGDIEELESLNKRLEQYFKADHCHNVDRIMRLPGTINLPDYRKKARGRVPVPARLLDRNDAAYRWGAFDFLPVVTVTPEMSKVARATAESGLPRFDELLPGDDALRKRWEGDTDGLKDASRSGFDMSLVSMMVIRGFNDAEITTVLHAFRPGKVVQDGRSDDYIKPMIALARRSRVLVRANLSWTAYRLLAECFTQDDGTLLLRHWRGDFYRYTGRAWQPGDAADIEAKTQSYLEGGHCFRPKDKGKREPYNPTSAGIENVRKTLGRITHVASNGDMPCWLDRRDGDPDPDPDPEEMLAMANGLLHLPSLTLRAHDPRLFTTTALPYAYDPHAELPTDWLSFLRALWPNDPESIETLQEWMGYLLAADASQQKMLALIGPPRAGKGVIAKVLQGMLGGANCIGPTLNSLGRPFGLQPLIGKSLAVVSDARFKFGSDVVTERLLSISGQDEMTIDCKYKGAWTGRLRTRFMLCSNELPSLEDASGALASRFILLRLTESWLGREDVELSDRLMRELPGIFNWALQGLTRLRKRGHFQQPASGVGLIQEFTELSSPIKVFLRDECVVDPDLKTECDHLYQSWKMWCLGNGRKEVGTQQQFGNNIRTVLPEIETKQFRVDGKLKRFYIGLGIAQALPAEFQHILVHREQARRAKLLL